MTRRQVGAALFLIVLVGAALRLGGIGFGLPNLNARPDETSITEIAVRTVLGIFDPRWFSYPTLFMYLAGVIDAVYCGARVAGGSMPSWAACADSWHVQPEPFFLITRCLSAVAGVASIPIVFLLGRRLGRDALERDHTGLAAAALLAVNFLHVRDSHFGVTDVPMTALLLGALLLLVRADDTPSRGRFMAAGLVAGLAAATKYNAALLVVPIVISQCLEWLDARHGARRSDARALVFALAALAGFAAGTPYAFITPTAFLRDLAFEAEHLAAGHANVTSAVGWVHHAVVTLPYGVGWPLMVTSVAGAGWVGWRSPRTASLLFAFPVAYYAVAGNGYTVFARYMVPMVPFVCLGAAALVARLASMRPWGAVAAGLIGVVGLAPNAWKSIEHDRLLGRKDSRVIAAEWTAHEVPEGASIYLTGSVYARPDLWRRGVPPPYAIWTWNYDDRQFSGPSSGLVSGPEWIYVQQSPLTSWDSVPPEVTKRLDHYELRQRIPATADQPHVYDQQDAWYLPLDGLSGIVRPGPSIAIYHRRD